MEDKKYILNKIDEYNNNSKKTIAMFCDCFYPSIDGVISVINNLSNSLLKYYNIVVCVPNNKKQDYKKYNYLVLTAKSIKTPGMDYECSLLPSQDREFVSYLNKLKIDLIHFHSPFFMGKFAVKYANKNNIPVVATFHSQYKQDFKSTTHSFILTKILLKNIINVFNKARLVFTFNEFCKNTFVEYGLKTPVKLIGNATNWVDDVDLEEIKKVETKYNLNKYENVLLFVGRLVKVKNLTMTVEILNELKKSGLNFIWLCIGEGSQLRKLSKMVKKFNLEENVLFTGKIINRKELEAIYARSDLFVFTSNYDCESIVGQEASIKGTPQVLLKNTGPACKVIDEENGFLCDNSVESFVNKIKQALSDKEKLNAVGQKAKNTIPLDWDSVAKLYAYEYGKIIKSEVKK